MSSSQTSSLQYLDARNTPLLDHSAPFVARALRISGSLAVLHLENAGLSGRPLMLLGEFRNKGNKEAWGRLIYFIVFLFFKLFFYFQLLL